MRKAVIIGASSGIGKELSLAMVHAGYVVGLVARRIDLLKEIQKSHPKSIFIKQVDICKENASEKITELLDEMGGTDIIVISSGTGFPNADLSFSKELQTIDTNVVGFTEMVNLAYHYFVKRRRGHLVAITSIAALRGAGSAPAYSATKAFQLNYLDGLRQNFANLSLPIYITEIRPGYVDTAMAKGESLFWMSSLKIATKQILRGITKKKRLVYITRRWRLIGWVIKLIPRWLYKKM